MNFGNNNNQGQPPKNGMNGNTDSNRPNSSNIPPQESNQPQPQPASNGYHVYSNNNEGNILQSTIEHDPITHIIVESDDDMLDDVSLLNISTKGDIVDDAITDVDISNCVFNAHMGATFSIDAVQLENKNILVATGGEDDKVKLWDYYSNKLLGEHTLYDSVITSHFNSHSRHLLTADLSGRIRVFNYQNVEKTFHKKVVELETENMEWCVWHPHMRSVIVAGRVDWIIQYWHYTTGRYKVLPPPMKVPSRLSDEYNGEAPYISFSKTDHVKLAVGYGDGSIAIWSMQTNAILHRFYGGPTSFRNMVSCIDTFSNDRVIVAGSRHSTALKLYNATANKYIGDLDDSSRLGHPDSINMVHNVVVTEDNQHIVMAVIINKMFDEEEEISRRTEIILNSFDNDGTLKNNGYNYEAEKTIERTNQKVFLGNVEVEEDELETEQIINNYANDEYEPEGDPHAILDHCNKKLEPFHSLAHDIPVKTMPDYEDLERNNFFDSNLPFIMDPNEKPPKHGSQIAVWNYARSRLMHVITFGSLITELANFKDNIVLVGFENGHVIGINSVQGKIIFKFEFPSGQSVHSLKYKANLDAIAVTSFAGESMLIDAIQIFSGSDLMD